MSLVRAVTNRLALQAANAGVDLFIQCGGGTLMGDQSALGVALFQLVAHAIYVSPEGRQVVLETVKTHDGDQYWVLHHAGRGVPVEPPGGAAHGLAVACEVIAWHGGRLFVESCAGSETTLTTIWLPHEGGVPPPQPRQKGDRRGDRSAAREP
jgi:signal transduction histidine kinase